MQTSIFNNKCKDSNLLKFFIHIIFCQFVDNNSVKTFTVKNRQINLSFNATTLRIF